MMGAERRKRLEANLIEFISHLEVEDLMDHLQASSIFNDFVVDKVKSQRTVAERRRCVLREIRCRGDDAYDALFLALSRTRQDQLAALLRPCVSDRIIQRIENEPSLRPLVRSLRSCSIANSPTSCNNIFSYPMELRGILDDLAVDVCDGPDGDQFLAAYEKRKDEIYSNFSAPKGICLIINNEKFGVMPHRQGTHVDCKNAENLFRQLGYQVKICHDLTAKGMLCCVRDFAADTRHRQASSAVLVVLTHGEHETLMGCDDEVVRIVELLSYLKPRRCPLLAGKPKLVFLQACRGGEYDHGFASLDQTDAGGYACNPGGVGRGAGDRRVQAHEDGFSLNPFACIRSRTNMSQEMDRIPEEADFLIAYATPSHFVSWRNSMHGSWFIQAVCEVFSRYASSTHILDMMTMVQRRVAEGKETKSPTMGGCKQIPETVNRLRRQFFFFPGVAKELLNGTEV